EKRDGTSVDAGNGSQSHLSRLDLGDRSGRPVRGRRHRRRRRVLVACRARASIGTGFFRGSRAWRGGMSLDPNPAGVMTRGNHRTPPGAADASAAPAVPDDLHALRAVVEGTAAGTGREFFRSLVRHLAEAIDVHYAAVSEFMAPRLGLALVWDRDR